MWYFIIWCRYFGYVKLTGFSLNVKRDFEVDTHRWYQLAEVGSSQLRWGLWADDRRAPGGWDCRAMRGAVRRTPAPSIFSLFLRYDTEQYIYPILHNYTWYYSTTSYHIYYLFVTWYYIAIQFALLVWPDIMSTDLPWHRSGMPLSVLTRWVESKNHNLHMAASNCLAAKRECLQWSDMEVTCLNLVKKGNFLMRNFSEDDKTMGIGMQSGTRNWDARFLMKMIGRWQGFQQRMQLFCLKFVMPRNSWFKLVDFEIKSLRVDDLYI